MTKLRHVNESGLGECPMIQAHTNVGDCKNMSPIHNPK
jgi:hypothetical protein